MLSALTLRSLGVLRLPLTCRPSERKLAEKIKRETEAKEKMEKLENRLIQKIKILKNMVYKNMKENIKGDNY